MIFFHESEFVISNIRRELMYDILLYISIRMIPRGRMKSIKNWTKKETRKQENTTKKKCQEKRKKNEESKWHWNTKKNVEISLCVSVRNC